MNFDEGNRLHWLLMGFALGLVGGGGVAILFGYFLWGYPS